ncbi:UNVERIFIED_ORG: gluconate 5-dehydrogenase [Xanthobacter viscosus]|uniref:SDR family NAD(P)-dependent oxidoreductase n=1 Tax=Xanthobacter autotrophicus TaxID=280 RepID=A0A6C1KBC7_XANAU|nr:SDR family oxidoreductase [Xanthobacter autotrophicus]TLX41402.1 SDR family NAD(P)-dependent oxidoreductase [Xanthobacter autotrophicus]
MTNDLHRLLDLSGRVAIVTGGSRGIGLQMAEALGEFGAHVVITARKAGELADAGRHLEGLGTACTTLVSDLSDPASIPLLVEAALAVTGRIDILVNNAGATWGAPAEAYPPHGWAKVMDLNLNRLFDLTREVAARAMLPQGYGRIINIASIAGLTGNLPGMEGTAAYNASKGGVISLTRALASEWGARGITVNALAPGYFPSKMTAGTLDRHGEKLLSVTPRGVLGGESDLKGAALLFASDAGAHITGQTLAVDGGMTAV